MKKTILQMLSAATLLAATAAPAMADVFHGANLDIETTSNYFIPVSSTGNSFTFTTAGPTYTPNGSYNPSGLKDAFIIKAHSGQALTGKMNFSLTAQYQTENAPQGPAAGEHSSGMTVGVDVLSPHCGMCGPYDADLLGSASVSASALSAGPSSGSWNLDSKTTDSVGTYDNLIAYMLHNYSLDPLYGSIGITSITFSFGTVAVPSPVPELPPVAMMGLGLAALALRVRYRKAKQK
ncbi:MAG: hypothetical protein ABIQ08_18020 [Duganella sp.]